MDLARLHKEATRQAIRQGFTGEHAEDLAQAVVMSALMGDLADERSLFEIRNKVVDEIRKYYGSRNRKKKYHVDPPRYAHKFVSVEYAHLSTPPPAIRDLENIMVGLKQNERVIIVLSYVWGFTTPEVAHALGIAESSVFVYKSSAFDKIRKRMSRG